MRWASSVLARCEWDWALGDLRHVKGMAAFAVVRCDWRFEDVSCDALRGRSISSGIMRLVGNILKDR